MNFRFRNKALDLSVPQVMGILNVTPDSFSDGGLFDRPDAALRHAESMIAVGAGLLDIGGESTRPGATPVSTQEELDRVVPVVSAIARSMDVVISVDTSNPVVIAEAANVGAHLINDVRALRREGALEAAVNSGLPVCLMHMKGEPDVMQEQPAYDSVVDEVSEFLLQRVQDVVAAGIPKD